MHACVQKRHARNGEDGAVFVDQAQKQRRDGRERPKEAGGKLLVLQALIELDRDKNAKDAEGGENGGGHDRARFFQTIGFDDEGGHPFADAVAQDALHHHAEENNGKTGYEHRLHKTVFGAVGRWNCVFFWAGGMTARKPFPKQEPNDRQGTRANGGNEEGESPI